MRLSFRSPCSQLGIIFDSVASSGTKPGEHQTASGSEQASEPQAVAELCGFAHANSARLTVNKDTPVATRTNPHFKTLSGYLSINQGEICKCTVL